MHFALFGGLAGLVALGLVRSNGPALPRRALILWPVAFATLYGLTDEIHQLFVPQRTFDLLDLLADAAGATIFSGGFAAWTARGRASA
jgi:VanZ family protein